MHDPLLSLAFSVHANRGVYALLLGSGVSRKARIPTGWAIVEDLIRRLAAVRNADCGADPAAWYESTFGEGADYSKLLEHLGRSPADRREILRGYFEPTPQEREEGAKQPTEAHRAIARLMKAGYVRVVLTTNFDRLLELALEDEGVRPVVIDSPEKAQGARPLTHLPAVIIKLHGDYLDDRIKNTLAELSTYEPPVAALLDRVLDEFGLVVCGWSGDWDPALRAAIERCPTRRFPTYWTHVAPPSAQAQRLLEHRQALALPIAGADEFFTDLQQKVEALEAYGQRHPASAAVARAMLERYLVSDAHRIRLRRLMDEETERVFVAASETAAEGEPPSEGLTRQHGQRLLAASDTLLQLIVHGCYWGETQHESTWVRTLTRLMGPFEGRGSEHWSALARYPAQLAFYAGGLAALARGRLETAAALFHQARVRDRYGQDEVAHRTLNTFMPAPYKLLPGGAPAETNRHYLYPASEGLFSVLRGHFRELIRSQEEYERLFDRFEFLLSLAVACDDLSRAPGGRFTPRFRMGTPEIVTELGTELAAQGKVWPPLQAGLLRGDSTALPELMRRLVEHQKELSFQLR